MSPQKIAQTPSLLQKDHGPSLSNPLVIFGKYFTFPGFYVRLTPS